MATLYGQAHVDRYIETGGAEGWEWEGTTVLLLTTTGRKTGDERTHALIYRDWTLADGTTVYLLVASKGGADTPPAWYLNLQAQPAVGVQIKDDRFAARARTATPEEKPEMWAHMLGAWPDYATYQTKTEREIPIIVLERS